jgi:predicted amidohydrolase
MSRLRIVWHQQEPEWEKPDRNLEVLTAMAPLAGDCDVWVLPEMFATGFSMNPNSAKSGSKALEWMIEMAKDRKTVVAGSLAFISERGPVNRFFWVQPDGSQAFYDKRNLFALAGETKYYIPGDARHVLTFRGWKIALFVCYDLRFNAWMYRREKFNYDIAIIVANWPERRSRAWKTLLSARAIENQSFVLGVNRVGVDGNGLLYSGDSRLIGPLGEPIVEANPFEPGNSGATLELDYLIDIRRRFPFWTGDLDA